MYLRPLAGRNVRAAKPTAYNDLTKALHGSPAVPDALVRYSLRSEQSIRQPPSPAGRKNATRTSVRCYPFVAQSMDFLCFEQGLSGDGGCKLASVNGFNAVLPPGDDGSNLADLARHGYPCA